LASVRDDAKPVSRSTRIGEKVERLGLEAFRSIDRHASGLAVSAIGVNRHTCQWCCVAAVSVSWWEWDVWHRSVAVSDVQPLDALHLSLTTVGGDSRFSRFPIGNHPRKARPAFNR